MTTLAVNKTRDYQMGDEEEYLVIASDIIYQGAAAGDNGAGYARPLVAGDLFRGFAIAIADNSAGSAGTISVNVKKRGNVTLSVSGVTITDVGQPVYATDDDTFTMSPIGASFIGFVDRFISSGLAVVSFDTERLSDPWQLYGKREVISANKTLDIEDNGKLFWVDTDAVIITLPAVATPLNCSIVNGGANTTVAVNISPNASDKVQGPDLPGTDNKDLINTKATARRGDFARLTTGDANGAVVEQLRGIWATEA